MAIPQYFLSIQLLMILVVNFLYDFWIFLNLEMKLMVVDASFVIKCLLRTKINVHIIQVFLEGGIEPFIKLLVCMKMVGAMDG